MKISGGYPLDGHVHIRHEQDPHRHHTFIPVNTALLQLSKSVRTEAIHDFIRSEYQGVRVSGGHFHDPLFEVEDPRVVLVGGSVVSQLAVDAPAPREDTTACGERDAVVLTGTDVDDAFFAQGGYELRVR